MYSYIENRGVIIRNSDGVVVAPTSDTEGQDYLDWLAWCAQGNTPTTVFEPAAPVVVAISHFAFLNRFTSTELIAIELAKQHNPAATIEQQTLAAHLRVHQHKFDTSQFIDLAHQETVDGLNGLEAAGLIASGRANEILTTPVAESEKP